MRENPVLPRVGRLLLATGLAVAAVGLFLWAAAVSATTLLPAEHGDAALRAMSQDPAAQGTIHGTIRYSGTVTGTHLVWVGAFTTTLGGPPAYVAHQAGPGPFTLTVEAGTYHLYAGMDADDSGGAPDPSVDPMGAYVANPVTVTAGSVLTGIEIILLDPASPPTDTGGIAGQISYAGRITGDHNVIIFAGRQDGQGPPEYAAVISGAGAYTITDVADATYLVGAFMDLDGDMGPPQPAEPFGWYDPGGDGQPDPVIVSGGGVTGGIDITLRDPWRYIYLPLSLKRSAP